MIVHFKFLQLLLCESLNIFFSTPIFVLFCVTVSVFITWLCKYLGTICHDHKKKQKNSQHHFSVRTVMNPEVTDIRKKKYLVYAVYFGNTFTLKLTNKDCFFTVLFKCSCWHATEHMFGFSRYRYCPTILLVIFKILRHSHVLSFCTLKYLLKLSMIVILYNNVTNLQHSSLAKYIINC